MANFYGTFGRNHMIRGHSLGNYYIKIVTSSYERATKKMFELFGPRWSMLYPQKTWDMTRDHEKFFPGGEIMRVTHKGYNSIVRMKKRKYDKVREVDHGHSR